MKYCRNFLEVVCTSCQQGDMQMQGEGQMGLFGGVGPVLGGTAGGKDYSLATMLKRAEHKQSGFYHVTLPRSS